MTGVNEFESFLRERTRSAIGIVVDAGVRSARELESMGLSPVEARQLAGLTRVYNHKTKFSRKQAIAREAALHLTFAELHEVERHMRGLKQSQQWDLRLQVLRSGSRHRELSKLAFQIASEMRTPPVRPAGVFVSRGEGRHTLRITDDQCVISALFQQIRDLGADAGRAVLAAVTGSESTDAPLRPIETNAVVTLDELDKVEAGDGDIVIRLTDGTTCSGVEYLQRRFETHGYAILVHPLDGPVNAYRTARFANDTQRRMAFAEAQTCCWPDCNVPADDCQIHHIKPWSYGGDTNMSNLATLCQYHNRVNQDDASGRRRRGRIVRPDTGGPPAWEYK